MPIDAAGQARFTIHPFDPNTHDRTAFSCGVPQIDNYLKMTANKANKADVVRVWVVVDEADRIIGFYGINMHAVDAVDMPDAYRKRALRHGLLPAAFISMIGVDEGHQGKGLGKALLADALSRIVRVSGDIAACVIMIDVFNDGNPDMVARRKAYYETFGFTPLPDQPLRLLMPVEIARQASNE